MLLNIETSMILILVLMVGILVYLGFRIVAVKEGTIAVIERLGVYYTTWNPGLHFLLPFFDRIRRTTSLKNENVIKFIPIAVQIIQYSIPTVSSKDKQYFDLTIQTSLQIIDPKMYIYGVNNPAMIIQSMFSSSIRELAIQTEYQDIIYEMSSNTSAFILQMNQSIQIWGVTLHQIEFININKITK